MNEEIENFVTEVGRSLAAGTFVKLTLSNYKGPEEHLQRISVRQIETKKGAKLAFQSRYSTRDIVKNFEFDEGVKKAVEYLKTGFRSGHLFTTENDIQLTIGKKSTRLTKGKPSFSPKPETSHDRTKKYLVDPSVYYLKALGITTENGQVRSDQRDKWRQINKFVEVVEGLIVNSELKDKTDLRVVDMGSGKGYLTFALYDHLRQNHLRKRVGSLQKPARSKGETMIELIGVEQRKELVALCNDIAKASSFDGLKFVQGTIADFDPSEVDILIALHACDTATDDALYKGIMSNASIIVAAPCCHHQLKKQLRSPVMLAGVLKHPVMLERTAETITDGIRSLLLEARGYRTKMFEFVAAEHTPKNNLLVAIKRSEANNDRSKLYEVEKIMEEFGIDHQRLAELIRSRGHI